jgi:hypothetical protein
MSDGYLYMILLLLRSWPPTGPYSGKDIFLQIAHAVSADTDLRIRKSTQSLSYLLTDIDS